MEGDPTALTLCDGERNEYLFVERRVLASVPGGTTTGVA